MSAVSRTSFLDLPRELRDLVYREVLYHEDGIHLKVNPARAEYRYGQPSEDADDADEADAGTHDSSGGGGGGDDDDDELPASQRRALLWQLFPNHPGNGGLLRTSRQVHGEALETLYGDNEFVFHTIALTALAFLHALPPRARRHVRRLGFGREALDFCVPENKRHWRALCAFVARHTRVRQVTIAAPIEPGLALQGPSAAPPARDPDDEEFLRHYYWQAAEQLVALLRAGAIATLRLAFSEPYAAADVDADAFDIVRRLRGRGRPRDFAAAPDRRRGADQGLPGATVLALTRGAGGALRPRAPEG